MNIYVCDAPMGSGKTESAITRINEDTDNKYIFLTPYLTEVERIENSCSSRNFVSPENKGNGKLDNLHYLLKRGDNIASTHALFSCYNDTTAELINNGNYILILDEVFCVVEALENIKKSDMDILFRSNDIKMADDGEHIIWLNDGYDGVKYTDVMEKAKSNNLILYKDSLLFWSFPVEIFKSFKEVIILTYMFKSQMQKYYYDLNHIDIEYIGVQKNENRYRFGKASSDSYFKNKAANLIHVLDDNKLNQIGEYEFSLSSKWFEKESKKQEKPNLVRLKNNIVNVFKNKYKSISEYNMWTTFIKHKNILSGQGYTNGFISCNVRATNDYRHKTHMAYCINIYFNPMFKGYFVEHGVEVDENGYALSEMIQWIWRSAIRDGKEVWIYIPSSRMRNLIIDWLGEGGLDAEV